MPIQFANYLSTTIVANLSAAATSFVVTSAAGMPVAGNGNYFYITLIDQASALSGASPPTQREVVKVTARVGTTLTVLRAQDGTSAQAFAPGSVVELRFNAQAARDLLAPYYFNVKDYGALGDGSTDDTVAIQNATNAALAANLAYGALSAGNTVFFPHGAYKTTALITASGAIRFLGAGRHEAVIFSSHAGGALAISTGSAFDEVEVCDLGFCANGAGSSGTAISITLPFIASASTPSVSIQNVHIFDTYGAAFWSRGIVLTECPYTVLRNVLFKGSGTIANWAVSGVEIGSFCTGVLIDECQFLGCVRAINVTAANVEGTQITNSSMVACTYGYHNDHIGTFPPHIAILGTHIAATTCCIYIRGSIQAVIRDCLLYLGDVGAQTTPNGAHAVHIQNHNFGSVNGNNIAKQATAAINTVGIYFDDGTLLVANDNTITNFATGIELQTLTINACAEQNEFSGTTTDIINAGTSSRIVRDVWQTWVPVITNTGGGGFTTTVQAARYQLNGKGCNFYLTFTVTAIGGGGYCQFVTPFTSTAVSGAISGMEAALGNGGLCGIIGGGNCILRYYNNAPTVVLNAQYWVSGYFEIA